MFWKKDKMIESLRMEIADLIEELRNTRFDDPRYQEITKSISELSDELIKLKGKNACWFSPDAFFSCLSSILGIVLILQHERLDVISSKALAFVPKPNFRSKK